MSASMPRVRALAAILFTAGVLTACGGGGGDSAPPPEPAPTVIPENLAITAPASAESATAVAFGNSASTLTGLKYQWDFGDGSSSTEAAPSHSFATGGEFEVVLKVTNSAGSTRETRTKVSITNVANVRGLECTGSASTGWCWQNPRPTGNRVNTVFFLNGTTGWRGGDNGEIFKTTDGGVTWARQATGITAGIYGIRFVNASTGWATGAFGALLRTTDGGTSWSLSKVGDPQYGTPDISTITAVDAKTVYLGRPIGLGQGTGVMYGSKDGGATWQSIPTSPYLITSTGKFWSLQSNAVSVSSDGGQSYSSVLSFKLPTGYNYFDSTNLWAQDDLRAVAYTRVSGYDYVNFRWSYQETFYTTVDGGVNWSKAEGASTGSTSGIQRLVSMSADGKVLLGSNYNSLLRSTDGGLNWAAVAGPSSEYYSVYYATLGNGELAASSYNGLWLSKDAGTTWSKLSNPNTTNSNGYYTITADSLRRVEAGVLLAFDNAGSTYLSRDDGQTWKLVVAPLDGNYGQSSVVAFSDAKNGFMVDAQSRVFTTKDGGATWAAKTLAMGSVRALQFVNKQTGWLVAGDGKLYKSTDAGATWATVPIASGVSFANVYFQNENLGWSQRSSGGAQYTFTRDGGKTWTELPLPYGVSSMRQGETSWVAVGSSGAIYVSTDAGSTWNATYTGTLANLTAVAFSDAKTAWAVGWDNTLLKSEDGGLKWSLVKLPGSSTALRDIKFANAKVGWIVGDNGLILATQDGGKTWRGQASGTANGLTSLQVVDANTAWITGYYGLVLATGTGGN